MDTRINPTIEKLTMGLKGGIGVEKKVREFNPIKIIMQLRGKNGRSSSPR
jgi:hypothetical protein